MNLDEEYLRQTHHLRQQLLALERKPRKVRERFQLLAVRCKRCSDMILEVVETDPWPVVRSRRFQTSGAGLTSRPTGRLDKRWQFRPFNIDETDQERRSSTLYAACRCSAHEIPMQWVHEQLDAGVRTTTR